MFDGAAGDATIAAPARDAGADASAGDAGHDGGDAGRPTTPPGWTEPTLVNIPNRFAGYPKVAIDAEGMAHIVVVGNSLWGAKLDVAGNCVERIVIADKARAAETALAHNAKDDIVVLYATPAEGEEGTTFATTASYSAAAGWHAPVPIGMATVDEIGEGHVSLASSGEAAATWLESAGELKSRIQVSLFNGTSWSAAETLDGSAIGQLALPTIALDPPAHALVAWRTTNETGYENWLLASSYNGSVWSAAQRVFGSGTQGGFHDVAFAGDTGVLLWSELNSQIPAYLPYYAEFSGASGWSAPKRVDSKNDASASGLPRLVNAGDDVLFGVWAQEVTPQHVHLLAARYEAGQWSTPVVISPAGYNGYPIDMAANSKGQAAVIWRGHSDVSTDDVWVSRFDPTTGWGGAVKLAAATENAWPPSIDIDEAGNIAAAWESGAWRVWATRFTASP